MEVQESLQILCNELRCRGLPRDYIERVGGELADHAADIAAELRDATELRDAAELGSAAELGNAAATSSTSLLRATQLGDPLLLAHSITCEYQRRTFLGRHPWLTFAVLPVGAMLTAWIATMLGMVLVVELMLAAGRESPSDALRWTTAIVAGALALGMTYGMPVLLGWWSLRIACQITCRWSWAWLTTAVLVLTSFFFRIDVFRLENGQFAIDSSGALRVATSYLLYGEALPGRSLLEWLMMYGGFPVGYLIQVAFLIGGTALVLRRYRQRLAIASA